MGLVDAVRDGRLAGLRTVRDVLAAEIEASSEKPQVAALVNQLRGVLADIAELEKGESKGSVVDALAERRKSRGTKGAAAASGRSVK